MDMPARTPQAHPLLPYIIGGLCIILIIAAYLVFANSAERWPFGAAPETPPPGPVYNNDQYGFRIPLTSDWQGYSVLDSQWEGRDIATGQVRESGPLVTIRHPDWTEGSPREDMPVMVFTLAQWSLIQQEKMSVGAAPFPPNELGQNSVYVLALPARYNYDFSKGWEEVDVLVRMLQAFEPESEGMFCTQDAKLCPDGSYVGRVPPSCEFAPCP